MTAFLGVPILLRGVAYGNLYLTDKAEGADFTEADQEVVGMLASQAAVGIENARLYESATRWSRQLESLIEGSGALARETDVDIVLELLAKRLQELLEARLVAVALPAGEGQLRIVTAAGDGADQIVGRMVDRAQSKAGRVLERGRSERVDSVIEDREVNLEFTRGIGARAGLWVPLLVHGRPVGVLTAYDKLTTPDARFEHDDVRLAETFASRGGGRRRAVGAGRAPRAAADRRGAGARAGAARARAARRDRPGADVDPARAQAARRRGGAVGRAPPRARGRDPAGRAAPCRRAAAQGARRFRPRPRPRAPDERFAEHTGSRRPRGRRDRRAPAAEVETAIYRIVQEALTNVVKHAHAQRVSVLVTRADGRIKAVIEDDGTGFDPSDGSDGVGLIGMRERIELLDGG
jgi:hypothetical protein